MSDFITPVVGQQYNLGDKLVEVTEAVKKRFWRIAVKWESGQFQTSAGEIGPIYDHALIPQAEWAAKASHVGAQE